MSAEEGDCCTYRDLNHTQLTARDNIKYFEVVTECRHFFDNDTTMITNDDYDIADVYFLICILDTLSEKLMRHNHTGGFRGINFVANGTLRKFNP